MAKTSRKIKRAVRPMKTERQRVDELAEAIGVPREQRANLGMGKVVDMAGELGKRQSTINVLVNRGGTAVERWVANDRLGLFGQPQQTAISYSQALWARAESSLRATDPTRTVVDHMVEGLSQQEALDELQWFKGRLPRAYWEVYENVCRFDEEAGSAGSRLASNSRSAIDAAKTSVAFTASLIAMWKRF